MHFCGYLHLILNEGRDLFNMVPVAVTRLRFRPLQLTSQQLLGNLNLKKLIVYGLNSSKTYLYLLMNSNGARKADRSESF